MNRAEHWRTNNDPHSPTHRSPEQSPRALADVGLEECGNTQQNRYIRQIMQRFQDPQQDPGMDPIRQHPHHHQPQQPHGVRFQDDRGAGVRPGIVGGAGGGGGIYHHDTYQHHHHAPTATATTINMNDTTHTTNNNNNNINNNTTTRPTEPESPQFPNDNLYESTESSSSLSSPLSSDRTPRYRGFDVGELEFSYHGQRVDDNDDDDEENSVVTHSTTNDEQHTVVRSALSSLNNNSAWGSVWDEFQPDYKLLHESYQTKKRDIFKDIENTMEKIRLLEKNYEIAKERFHNQLATSYNELCTGLVQKRNRIEKTKTDFEAAANTGKDKTIFPSEKVKLNVGGTIFETSLSTLRREEASLLATMFSGRHQLDPEDDGSYFIDRDPKQFRLVLNYLRDLRVPPSIGQDQSIRHELLQEAKYYRIDSLVELLH
ncbi:hypothetical protein BDA99DRAFT_506219 [Phascolomyces articulosus]|uniref:BTB domain-containing protein n=1 Tax=Phascolomyces articulosus TaxID=60185 RepID=A0AAD5PFI9_9FUNG|nr:hypothetical protein BDA99DRAFT_506219 [Phascolomyces articulosus]